MASENRYELAPDRKGVWFDLLLYIPTFIILLYYAATLWYAGNKGLTYVLVFASTLIFLIAFNRIAKSRLMLLPSSPIAMRVSKKDVALELRDGSVIQLVKDVRFFSDLAGKSFGLAGVDMAGKPQKFVFHKGQFPAENQFNDIKSLLRIFS